MNVDLKSIGNVIGIILPKVRREVKDASYEEIIKRLPQLAEITGILGPALEDGFQAKDLSAFGKCVEPFMELADDVNSFTGPQKKQFVIDAVWFAFRTLDTYPDGKQNNINLPILSGRWEKAVERRLVIISVGWVVEALYDRRTKKRKKSS